jgi:hypothetical protein
LSGAFGRGPRKIFGDAIKIRESPGGKPDFEATPDRGSLRKISLSQLCERVMRADRLAAFNLGVDIRLKFRLQLYLHGHLAPSL